ncbi:5'-nucleotidase C-terminal domain-containing protein [Rossellomorea sp. KS-H15a]|uniref:5'-nucleotidase C-terminal domain-containing protein n=1 Tax=Rossellomorea sp. KS-H15a TaxID=2963940 RepID=UPI0020C6C7C0|nr:5'-nucleotidase C-terminal domain-containing protein [Rossellomorea sp. KS-H15a]UTE77361.1 5'-nucleotidase C-terminal domain-containing protein [Rossellomorea sp. KS-H15a]
MMKKSLFVILSTLLVLSGFGGLFYGSASAEEPTTKTITILHTNDSHSKVKEGTYEGMGFAKMATLIKQYEAENENTLLLDAGDTFHGTPFATLSKGESIAELFNALGYDALAAGNHDFNYGYARLLELAEMVNFPIMSANVRYKADDKLLLNPYIIKEVDGVKLGIFGLSTPETTYKTNPKNVEGLKFTDPVTEAKSMVDELQSQNVDAIIALTHLGTDASSTETSIKVAENAPGIDLIVDGHSHTTDMQEYGVDTLIVSAGEYTENLGVVQLTFEGNELVDKEADLVTKEEANAQGIKEDAEIGALITSIEDKNKEVLSEVVGTTEVKLDGERAQVRAGETNLGNLITDAMMSATNADAAITNGGGIRASIDQGEITKEDVVNVLPFGNYVVTKKFTGATIKAALEHGTSDYPNVKGAFPHVSGMTYELDVFAPAGERIKNLHINGEPVDMEKEYLVATNDFMAVGGDDYTMFTDGPLVNEFSALDEILINHIKENTPVDAKVENRFNIYTPFTDLDWSKKNVEYLYARGIIKGFTDTEFAPFRNVNRAQFASMLVRAFDLEATGDTPFTDLENVKDETKQEIAAAYEAKLVKGTTPTTFDPYKAITRAQMALMMKRAYEWKMEEAYESTGETPFKDLGSLEEEAQTAIELAYHLGIVEGYGDMYKPYTYATRSQSAKVIALFLQEMN